MKTQKTISIIIGVLFLCNCFAQDKYFMKTYGDSGFEDGHIVHQLSDTTFLIAGVSQDPATGIVQPMLLKINQFGDSLWMKRVNTSFDVDIHGFTISNDTIALCGKTEEDSSDHDIYVCQLTLQGDEIWSIQIGDTLDDVSNSIICLNREYFLTGSVDTGGAGLDLALIRLDYSGNIIGQNSFDYGLSEYGRWIESVEDTALIIAGYSMESDSSYSEALLTLMSLEGEQLWTKNFQNLDYSGSDSVSFGYSVEHTRDSGFVLAGWSYANIFGWSRYYEAFIVKTDYLGNEVWRDNVWYSDPWAGTGGTNFHSVEEMADGSFLLTGASRAQFICKQCEDPEFEGSGLMIVKYDKNGQMIFMNEFNPENGDGAFGTHSIELNDSTLMTVGYQGYDYETDGSVVVVLTNLHGTLLALESLSAKDNTLLVYPNPSNGEIVVASEDMISITVYDLYGRIVSFNRFNVSEIKAHIQLDNLPNGQYIVALTKTDSSTLHAKIIISK